MEDGDVQIDPANNRLVMQLGGQLYAFGPEEAERMLARFASGRAQLNPKPVVPATSEEIMAAEPVATNPKTSVAHLRDGGMRIALQTGANWLVYHWDAAGAGEIQASIRPADS